MAIQVSGTEVISNSRVLSSVTGLKTVGGTAILGSGDIAVGGSTDADAVGTYTWGRPQNYTNYPPNSTATSIYPVGNNSTSNTEYYYLSIWRQASPGTVRSGTWRAMSYVYGDGTDIGNCGLWVRIS
jgi:hypothetical protein